MTAIRFGQKNWNRISKRMTDAMKNGEADNHVDFIMKMLDAWEMRSPGKRANDNIEDAVALVKGYIDKSLGDALKFNTHIILEIEELKSPIIKKQLGNFMDNRMLDLWREFTAEKKRLLEAENGPRN